jgi:pheromone shutdown protein TraB
MAKPEPEVRDISPDTGQHLVDETNQTMAKNSDIKARVE